MKKTLLFAGVLLLLQCAVSQEVVTLTFTAQKQNLSYQKLDSVVVTNLSRNWTEVLMYPDTVLTMKAVGIADYENAAGEVKLYRNIPNPFYGTTDFNLALLEDGKVDLMIFDINGKKVAEYHNTLENGEHTFRAVLGKPQTYLLSATTRNAKTSIKMVNLGNAGEQSRIEYLSGRPLTLSMEKGATSKPCSYGDTMRYVGYVTQNGDSKCVAVEQVNHGDEAIVFTFPSVADLVVYGKIYTAEGDSIAEAFAVKDGKYICVGGKEDVEEYIAEGETQVLDCSGKGLVMPSCGNGHAHYMMGYAMKTFGTPVALEDDVQKFLYEILPVAAKKAKDNGAVAVVGSGWNYHVFEAEGMPTREQLDSICPDIPVFFSDDEGHKGLANTLCLVNAGVMKADGTVLMQGTDIRGGEIVTGADGKPTGLLKEQAATFVRAKGIDYDELYTVEVADKDLQTIEKDLLAKGYTMCMDGWSNYFYNTNFYQAAHQRDTAGILHLVLGMGYELESWMNVDSAIATATDMKKYASDHVLPRWIKLFIDGTVEGGTGYCAIPYPDGHRGIVNWTEQEVTDITTSANNDGLTMHIHTMGDSAVALAVSAFVKGGQDEKRNTVVHVRNVLPETWTLMANHNIYATSGMHWHHFPSWGPIVLSLLGMVPEGYEDKSYPMKSYFDYGVNVSSHTDYPALSGSPDDPFGVMEIAVTGIDVNSEFDEETWWKEELLTRDRALKALTINCAKQLFLENERGSIRVGKYADFILVNKDVLDCPENEIHEAKVTSTYFEGKKVY